MACISYSPEILGALSSVQATLSQITNGLLALSGETCNIFGALGALGVPANIVQGIRNIEQGVQQILGSVGTVLAAVNSALAQVQTILNNVLDTALGAIDQALGAITGAIGQVAAIAQQAATAITGYIDEAIGLLKERAGISEILACAGVLSQLGILPTGITQKIDQITQLVRGGFSVSQIVNQMIADARDDLVNRAKEAVGGFVTDIGNQINSAQNIINVNINQLRSFSCAA
jgi:phage-related protein